MNVIMSYLDSYYRQIWPSDATIISEEEILESWKGKSVDEDVETEEIEMQSLRNV